MKPRILDTFAVTCAFGAGALITALVLDLRSVQAFLGMVPLPAGDLVRAGIIYVGIAVFAGLVIDGLRLTAATFWRKNRQLQHDLEDIFRDSLA